MVDSLTAGESKLLERFSYSKISCFKQCRFKYYLKYDQKNFLCSTNIATDFGSLVHATEESIALAIQADVPIDYVSLKNKFIIEARKLALKYPTEFYSQDKSGRTYQEKVYLYLESAIYRLENFLKQNTNLRIIGIEQHFEYDYDGVHSFNGSIDRAFLNIVTDEILIQDIKTWSVPVQNSELKTPLQFAIYMMAAEQLWNVPVSRIQCEYDLPLCDKVQPALSEDVVAESRPILDKLFQGIHNSDFKPSITALCHWCEYNPLNNPSILDSKPDAVCPYFSTWQKSGDNVRETLITWQNLESVPVDRQLCISQLRQQAANN